MKRFTALILTFTILFGIFSTACSVDDRRRNRREEEEQEEEETTRRRSFDEPLEPRHDFSDVDVSMEFDDFQADYSGTPWVLENNIPFTSGNIYEYFNQFLYNTSTRAEIPTTVYNNLATIYRPNVRHYPAEQDGYTIYEVSYVEYFPTSIALPVSSGYNTSWYYHGVGFIDYYTGTIYPKIEMSSDIDSFCVSGDVSYNGDTYTVYYYEYREQDILVNETTQDSDGNDVWEFEVTESETCYFVVPNGYDGIVMFVYTADDTYRTWDEIEAMNNPFFTPPSVFGEFGENIDDYTFLSISELG